MWKKQISGALLLALFSTSAVFAHSAEIHLSNADKYQAIRLTPEIYNSANSDLSDILIKDSKGDRIPYFIHTSVQEVYQDKEIYPMRLINSYTKDEKFYFDYTLMIEQEQDVIATSIDLITNNTDFAKNIEIYGSYDDINWEFIQKDKIYDIDGKSKLNIDFNQPEKYTHYRFQLANNLEAIQFETVNLVYNVSVSEESYFIEEFIPQFSVEEEGKSTLIKVLGLKNLRLYDVTIETDSMFKRMVSAQRGFGEELYNLSINDVLYTDTTLSLHGQIPREDIYVITIANNDDKPINIKGITIRYYADEIVFEGDTKEQYTFEFGADETKVAPVYDIVSYQDEILKGVIGKADIGEISYEEIEEVPEERDYKQIFNVVVVIITVLLGGVILFNLRRKPE